MSMPELFFLGKLRKHRDFLASPSLSHTHRIFWDSWFNRCYSDNQLTPFLIRKKLSRRVWLFLVKQDKLTYVGLTTSSEDLVGRDYPFLLFTLIPSENCLQETLIPLLWFFNTQAIEFEAWVVQGYMEQDWQAIWYSYMENKLAELTEQCNEGQYDNLQYILKVMVTHYEAETYVSNWFDIKSHKCVMHSNTLTCSLYNKIFG